MIGIIGAMEMELDRLISDMNIVEKKNVSFLDFYIGKLYSKDVVIVKSNEGKVNSAVATQILISNFDIQYVLNVGVAGSISDNLNVFDVAISNNTVEFDQDVSALGYEIGHTFGIDKVRVPASERLSVKVQSVCDKLSIKSEIGTILSSDKFIVDKNEKETLKKKFNGIAIDMESASINHVAYLNNKEFVTLRIISDSGNNIEYRKFAEVATENISRILKEYLEEENI